jgi:hypothetical protein
MDQELFGVGDDEPLVARAQDRPLLGTTDDRESVSEPWRSQPCHAFTEHDPPVIESRLMSDGRDLDRMLSGMDHALAAFGAMAEGHDAELLIPGHSLRPRKAPRAHPAAAFDRVSPQRHLPYRSRGRRALPAPRGARTNGWATRRSCRRCRAPTRTCRRS